MKQGIHPNYVEATVICSCGNTFQTRSTRSEIRTDLCSVCHPFYTGEQRIVDTAGQVERFTRRMERAQQAGGAKSKRQRRIEARQQQLIEQGAAPGAAAEEAAAEASGEE